MSQPQSVKAEPWSDFPKQPYSLFTDNFPHEKKLTLKINATGSKNTSSAKAKIALVDYDNRVHVQDELRLWWQLKDGRTLYTKVKSGDYLKLHLDNGIQER